MLEIQLRGDPFNQTTNIRHDLDLSIHSSLEKRDGWMREKEESSLSVSHDYGYDVTTRDSILRLGIQS